MWQWAINFKYYPVEEKSTVDLFNEFQKLKEKTKTSDNLQFFTNDVFNDKKQYGKIYAFADRRKGNRIEDLKSKIEKFIQNKGTNETGPDVNSDVNTNTETSGNNGNDNSQSNLTVDDEVRNNTTPPPSSSFFSYNLWTIVLTVLFIVTIISLFILNRRISDLKRIWKMRLGN